MSARDRHARKRRLFELGARSYISAFPDLSGRPSDPVYPCPLCIPLKLFGAESLDRDDDDALTVEHVPPEQLGGKPVLLTCKRCNSLSGRLLDADAIAMHRQKEILRGGGAHDLRVIVTIGDHRLNALVKVRDGAQSLEISPKANRPDLLGNFRNTVVPVGTIVTVEYRERTAELGMRISWLRSTFLAVVAARGFAFAFDDALDVVRRQIAAPDTSLAERWTAGGHIRLLRDTPALVEISDPHELRSYGLYFDNEITLVPAEGNRTFYQEFANRARSGAGLFQQGVVLKSFPMRATFGLSVASDSQNTGPAGSTPAASR